jgi:hypothetical protein
MRCIPALASCLSSSPGLRKHTGGEADIVDLRGPRSGPVLTDVKTDCHGAASLVDVGSAEGALTGCKLRADGRGSVSDSKVDAKIC